MLDLKQQWLQGRIGKADYILAMSEWHTRLHDLIELLKPSVVRAIHIEGDGIRYEMRNGVGLYCPKGDPRPMPLDALNFGDYEAAELRLLLAAIDDDSFVLDIGANIGWYSINMSRQNERAKIWSFEPIPGTYQFLLRNLAFNHVKNCEAFPFGLSNSSGTVEFHLNAVGSVNASLAKLASGGAYIVKAEVKRLDDLTLPKDPTVIKVDIEGAELLFLQGAAVTIRRSAPIVFCEMLRKWSAQFNYHPNDIIRFMRGMDYACYAITGGGLAELAQITDETTETNFMFLNKSKHSDYLKKIMAGIF